MYVRLVLLLDTVLRPQTRIRRTFHVYDSIVLAAQGRPCRVSSARTTNSVMEFASETWLYAIGGIRRMRAIGQDELLGFT